MKGKKQHANNAMDAAVSDSAPALTSYRVGLTQLLSSAKRDLSDNVSAT